MNVDARQLPEVGAPQYLPRRSEPSVVENVCTGFTDLSHHARCQSAFSPSCVQAPGDFLGNSSALELFNFHLLHQSSDTSNNVSPLFVSRSLKRCPKLPHAREKAPLRSPKSFFVRYPQLIISSGASSGASRRTPSSCCSRSWEVGQHSVAHSVRAPPAPASVFQFANSVCSWPWYARS